jgi:polyhydroxyalkanoate synthesis regulator phasin
MDENKPDRLTECAERMAQAAAGIKDVLERLECSQEALHAKIDRIIAAIEEHAESDGSQLASASQDSDRLRNRIAELERINDDLKAQTTRAARKTLSPLVSGLLSKSGVEEASAIEAGALRKHSVRSAWSSE